MFNNTSKKKNELIYIKILSMVYNIIFLGRYRDREVERKIKIIKNRIIKV